MANQNWKTGLLNDPVFLVLLRRMRRSSQHKAFRPALEEAPGKIVCLNLPTPIPDSARCEQFGYARIDRPRDIAAVIDELENPSQIPRLGPLADTARIAVGGHSAGSPAARRRLRAL